MTTAEDRIIARLQAGDRLHMQLCDDGKRAWWFERPLLNVQDRTMLRLLSSDCPPIKEAGDSLFGFENNSQTYISAETERMPS